MKARRTLRLPVAGLCLIWTFQAVDARHDRRQTGSVGAGAVVEQVLGAWANATGLQAGDVIFSWTREANPPSHPQPASGVIETSLDLRDVELEQAPRGPVVLRGRRGEQSFEWRVLPGAWAMVARPLLAGKTLQLHEEAVALRQRGELGTARDRWQQAVEAAKAEGNANLSFWFLSRLAGELANARSWTEADPAFELALAAAPENQPIRRVRLLTTWGRTFEGRDPNRAIERYDQALALRRKISADSLEAAYILHLIGSNRMFRGQLDQAQAPLEEARRVRATLAPGSVEVADSLLALGTVAWRRRDLGTARRFWEETLAIERRVAPDSLRIATTLNSLGAATSQQGDLPGAKRLFEQALQIGERLAPISRDTAISLMNLGGVARDGGDTPTADQYFQRAFAVAEKAGVQGLDLANFLQNIGNVAADRGDYARAEEFSRRALEIRLKAAPVSLDAALSLGSLGVIAWSRGDLAGSADYHLQALAIQQKIAPRSAETALTLTNLGLVAWKSGRLPESRRYFDDSITILEGNHSATLQYGVTLMNRGLIPLDEKDLTAAETYFTKSLQVLDRAAPNSLAVSMLHNNLGDIARRRGMLDAAESFNRQALEIRQTLAPGTSTEAESYHVLGTIARSRGSLDTAFEYYGKAVDALETQDERLGGSQDVRSGFGAGYRQYYRDLIELLVQLDRPNDAFAVLERSRARALLAMMAQRDLAFTDVTPELAQMRQANRAEADRIYARLSTLDSKKKSEEIQALLGRLRILRDERQALIEKTRQSAPRYAALKDSKPLSLEAAVRALDPGTVMLSYSVGQDRSFLFAVRAGGDLRLEVFALPIGEAALRSRVREFRRAIQEIAAPTATRAVGGVAVRRGTDPVLDKSAAALYSLLVKPAERLIASSDRLLIVPDGPLHALPFGVLAPGNAARPGRYLIEWKPLHQALSATVYNELRQNRRDQSGARAFIAFGDPAYQSPDRGNAATRPGMTFAPLPGTRREVTRIAALFPGLTTVHLGNDATEERAKALARDARFVHFATHALVDERFPLNSALALSAPPASEVTRENGLLQVWEIFEQLRLDADLVTLSACETALGEEMGGEGLAGLTRAFHYAGARSVVASLWSVADASTSELMTRFYRHLAAGKSKDVALRTAQLDLIRGTASGGRFAHPFHWAAFELFGDWR